MRRFAWRVLALFRRSRLERELDNEIAAHLELATAEHVARGMDPEEAQRAALRRFGGVVGTKEAYRAGSAFPLYDAVCRDVRYALRGMRRTPGFAAIAVTTLALAIGTNAAIFSVVNQLLVRPLPYPDGTRLVAIDATHDYEGTPRPVRAAFQLDAAARLQASLHVFADTALYADTALQLATRDGAEIVDGALVSPSFFSTLGGQIVAGRPITAADQLSPSIVISDRLWRRLFNGSREAIGARLELNGKDYVVIGIAAPAWDMPSQKTDVWQSVAFAHVLNAQCCFVQLLGKVKPGATIAQANTDVQDAARALAPADPRTFEGLHTSVTSLREKQLGNSRAALLLLWAVVGVVLMVACANLFNLLVARNLARASEFRIRQALGASRGRLILQGIIESALLALGGVAGGLLLAWMGVQALARVDPETCPRLQAVRMDPFVLTFTAGLGVATVLVTGIWPSAQAAKARTLRMVGNASPRHHRRLQRLLCVGQLAAALVLLVAATLLGRSFVDLLNTDLGVMPEHVLTASINVALGRPHTAQEIEATMQRVVERVGQVPGVQAVGAGTSLPPDTSRLRLTLKRKGDQVDYLASAVVCTPDYFRALGIRLIEGRFFTNADDALHPAVVIVSATTARHLFGDADPLGQTMNIPKMPYTLTAAQSATVVGVVDDVKYSGIDSAPGDQVYLVAGAGAMAIDIPCRADHRRC